MFQTVGDNAVKFVVDRRPSKTLLAGMHLWNDAETAAVNPTEEVIDRNVHELGVEVSGKQHKWSKKRQRSDDVQDHSHGTEISAIEKNISLPLTSGLDEESKQDRTSGDGKVKRRKKGEQKQDSKNIVAKIREDLDVEPETEADQKSKKHETLVDENCQRTELESDGKNESGSFGVISRSELSSSVDMPHHSHKKHAKNRHKASVDATDGAVNKSTAVTVVEDLGMEPDVNIEPAVDDTPDSEVLRPPSAIGCEVDRVNVPHRGHKKHAKSRREASIDAAECVVNDPTAGTAGKDLGMEAGVSEKVGPVAGNTHEAEVIQTASGIGSECERVNIPCRGRKKRAKNYHEAATDATKCVVNEPTAVSAVEDPDLEPDDRNESERSAVVLGSIDVPHRGRKKRAKNRHELSVDATEGAVEPATGTAGNDLGMEADVSAKIAPAATDTHNAAVVQSPSGMSSVCERETPDVEKSPRVPDAELSLHKLIMHDDDVDDDAGKVASGSEVTGSTQSKVLSTPTLTESHKITRSPDSPYKAPQVTQSSEEAVTDSPSSQGHSSPSILSPGVALYSAVVKKSLKKTSPKKKTGSSSVHLQSSPGYVSAAGPQTDAATFASASVCYVTGISVGYVLWYFNEFFLK